MPIAACLNTETLCHQTVSDAVQGQPCRQDADSCPAAQPQVTHFNSKATLLMAARCKVKPVINVECVLGDLAMVKQSDFSFCWQEFELVGRQCFCFSGAADKTSLIEARSRKQTHNPFREPRTFSCVQSSRCRCHCHGHIGLCRACHRCACGAHRFESSLMRSSWTRELAGRSGSPVWPLPPQPQR